MSDGIGDLVTGALYQQLRMGVISNNLANINTIGFKKDQVMFEPMAAEAMSDEQTAVAAIAPNLANFAANIPAYTSTDFSQGQVMHTGNKLDVALNGKGFFAVETPEGIKYTRKGSFTVNEASELCTQQGYAVLGEAGRISIDDSDIQIDETGNISVGQTVVDKLKIVDFPDNALVKSGEGLFTPANEDISETIPENIVVQQGYVEQSNVNAVKMMTEMIDTLRGYETYQKMIQSLDQTNALAIEKVGQVA